MIALGRRSIPRVLYFSTQTRTDSHSWTRRRLAPLLTMTAAAVEDGSDKETNRTDSMEDGTAGETYRLVKSSFFMPRVLLVLRPREQELYRPLVT